MYQGLLWNVIFLKNKRPSLSSTPVTTKTNSCNTPPTRSASVPNPQKRPPTDIDASWFYFP